MDGKGGIMLYSANLDLDLCEGDASQFLISKVGMTV